MIAKVSALVRSHAPSAFRVSVLFVALIGAGVVSNPFTPRATFRLVGDVRTGFDVDDVVGVFR